MSNNRAFFGRKICIGCHKLGTVFTCTGTGNKVYCNECHKKFVNQKFNGLPFKSLDEIAKENSKEALED